jgi:hypothetical protein
MMRPSRDITEPFPAVCFASLHPLDDCPARSSEDSGGKRGILFMRKEELDHGSAKALRVLGISDALIV